MSLLCKERLVVSCFTQTEQRTNEPQIGHTLAMNIKQKTSAPCVILWRTSHHSLWSALSTCNQRGTPSTVSTHETAWNEAARRSERVEGEKKDGSLVLCPHNRAPVSVQNRVPQKTVLAVEGLFFGIPPPLPPGYTNIFTTHLQKFKKPTVLHCSALSHHPVAATPGTYGSVIADRGYPSPLWSCLQLHCLCDAAPTERRG